MAKLASVCFLFWAASGAGDGLKRPLSSLSLQDSRGSCEL